MSRLHKWGLSFVFGLVIALSSFFVCDKFLVKTKVDANIISKTTNEICQQSDQLFEQEKNLVNESTVSVEISVESNMGTVTGAGRYAVGEFVTITAEEKDGREFKNWQIWTETEVGGDVEGSWQDWLDENDMPRTDKIVQFQLDSDITLRALFDYVEYSLTTNLDEYYDLDVANSSYQEDSSEFVDVLEEDRYKYVRNLSSREGKTYGKYFYNDVVTLNYTQKDSTSFRNSFIKELSASNFSSTSRSIVAIHLNEDGKVVAIEKDNVKTLYDEIELSSLTFDYQNSNYVILTQKPVGEDKYVTTNVTIKTRIKEHIEFSLYAEKLKNITLYAKEYISDNSAIDLNFDDVKDLINFEYGYYGVVDELNSVSTREYLVQETSFYKFSFSSNLFFNFKRVFVNKYLSTNEIIGDFSSGINGVEVQFTRNSYCFNIHQYLRHNGETTKMDNILLNSDDSEFENIIYALPTNALKIDATTMSILLKDNEATDDVLAIFVENLKFKEFGYVLSAITTQDVTNLSEDEINGLNEQNFQIAIDETNPENLNIYLVFDYIEYNFNITLVDTNGNPIGSYIQENETITNGYEIEHYIVNFNNNFMAKRGDVVTLNKNSKNLTTTAKNGYEILGWKVAGKLDYLDELSYEFVPISNDVTILEFECVIDYDYINIEYVLDETSVVGDEESGYEYMGSQSVLVVNYFTFDEPSLSLGVNASLYSEGTITAINFEDILTVRLLTEESSVVGEKTIVVTTTTYSSRFGDVKIVKTSTTVGVDTSIEFNYLIIANRTFVYNDSKFESLAFSSKQNIDITNIVNGKENKYQISTLTCDDLILLTSKNNDEAKYKFFRMIHIKDGKKDLKKYSLDLGTETYYFYPFDMTENTNISVIYISVTGNVLIASNNTSAYSTDNIVVGVTASTTDTENKVNKKDNYWEVVAITNSTIIITIDKSKIDFGYKFAGFKKIDKDLNEEILLGDETVNDIVIRLTMNNSLKDCSIQVMFEEIEYIITVENTNSQVTYAQIGEDAKNNKDNLEDGVFKFTIKRSDLISTPTINVLSSAGHYVKEAYLQSSEHSVDELVGENVRETNASLNIDANFFRDYIAYLAQKDEITGEYNLTLYIVEDLRIYSLYVYYDITNLDNVTPIKDVEITLSYNFGGEEIIETKSIKESLNNLVVFTNIPYNSELTLSKNDAGVVGVDYENWKKGSSVFNVENFVITDDIDLTLNYKAKNYKFRFVTVEKKEREDGYIYYTPTSTPWGEVEPSNLYVLMTEKVDVSVKEYVGYKFVGYGKDGLLYYVNGYNLIGGISKKDDLEFTISFDSPTYFLPQSAIANNETEVVFYMVFAPKNYILSYEITGPNKRTPFDEKYFDQTNYYILASDEDKAVLEGEPDITRYKFGASLEIMFRLTENAGTLTAIDFGSSKLSKNASDLYLGASLGGQIITLSYEEREINGEKMYFYVLKFVLSADMLEGVDQEFVLTYKFTVLKYTMSVSSDLIDKGLQYNITYAYGIDDGSTKSDEDKTVKKEKISYKSGITFSIDCSDAIKEFNDKYRLNYIYLYLYNNKNNSILEKPLIVKQYSINNPFDYSKEAVFDFSYNDNGEIVSYWEIIEKYPECNSFMVYFDFSPQIKIKLNYNDELGAYLKTTTYNAKKQGLTYSTTDENADIVYPDDSEIGQLSITYFIGSSLKEPRDVGDYIVNISFGADNSEVFEEKIIVRITPKELSLTYLGDDIVKEYDGTYDLTQSNLLTLKDGLLKGLTGFETNEDGVTDKISLDLKSLSAKYSNFAVSTNLDINTSKISLPSSVKNYCFKGGVQIIETIHIEGRGTITAKRLEILKTSIDLKDMLYYEEGEQPNLKEYNNLNNETFIFSSDGNKSVVGSDAVYIDVSKLELILLDYSIGRNKKVVIKFSSALEGEDKGNYIVNDIETFIDIYPSKLEYKMNNGTTFKIEDKDELFVIPIETNMSKFSVTLIDSSSDEYPDKYRQLASTISRNEKLLGFYRFNIYSVNGNIINLNNLEGAYVSIEPIKKLTSIHNFDKNSVNKLDYTYENKVVNFIIDDNTKNEFSIAVAKSYFAIWKIILIIVSVLILLIILIVLYMIYRKWRKERKRQNQV